MKIYDAAQTLTGQAVFLPPLNSLWSIRQASKQAILEKRELRPFVAVSDEMYYPNMINALLRDREKLLREAEELGSFITGADDGKIRCYYLWESDSEGILLHREGSRLLCAFVPVITREIAAREHVLAETLAAIADMSQDAPVYLETSVKAGKRGLRDILLYLSEQINSQF